LHALLTAVAPTGGGPTQDQHSCLPPGQHLLHQEAQGLVVCVGVLAVSPLSHHHHSPKFSVYVEELEKGTKRARDQYLAVQNIHRAFPPIANEFQLPIFVPKIHRFPFPLCCCHFHCYYCHFIILSYPCYYYLCIKLILLHRSGPFLWIAPAGHFEYLHIDPDDNFLLILSGSKTVRLFSPGTNPSSAVPFSGSNFGCSEQISCRSYILILWELPAIRCRRKWTFRSILVMNMNPRLLLPLHTSSPSFAIWNATNAPSETARFSSSPLVTGTRCGPTPAFPFFHFSWCPISITPTTLLR